MQKAFTAVIQREEDMYVALCPELDVVSQGDTVQEARENVREAGQLFLEDAAPEEVEERLHDEQYVSPRVRRGVSQGKPHRDAAHSGGRGMTMEQQGRPTGEDARLAAARQALEQCFWGDYALSAEEIVRRLDEDEEAFKRFFFGRIADDARYPSRLLRRLFSPEEIESILAATVDQDRWSDLRHRLIRSNLTGDRSLVPERSWSR